MIYPISLPLVQIKMAVKNISCKMEEALISCALGKIQISACEKGIHEIKLQEDAVPESRTKGASVSFEIVEGPREMIEPLKQCTAWLRAYFCEPRLTEKLPVPAFHHPTFAKDSFTKAVLMALLQKVKFGETVSYKELAVMAGNEKAVRAVGGAMRNNPVPILIPCHRVICSNGSVGNYIGGKGNQLKPWLLAHEKLLKEM
ncbi:methylated-DNA--protein-cysteine methyltransferase isoform X1 [Xenopus tropicalis]|uniref:Methylated-DNA--protein-cysteine methyltransferase n=1 Tax=Xenopus tropicalis TaxID=8364 RepID=F7AWA8_XENTR|nr:methylated-DNA--protein-cysteine methyltransferase isoform X1 [Xenopus tropicalis]|eukprot:XP_017950857.1 PREDICTED: methylated-DNA--protein-cysteine methyltransferase isoform X3 [Xenopus tropicalis]